jgi:biopolymer transport protein ExbB
MDVIEFFRAGGVPMYLIAACSVAAVAIVIERAIRIERARTELPELLRPVAAFAREGRWDDALRHCDRAEKPASRVARAGLERRGKPRAEIREALEDGAERELVGLERWLDILSVIAHVTPLIGLLGTVIGMIDAFRRIETAGSGPVAQSVLSGGIWQALLTTAAGLSVAIPVYVAHRILQGRVARHAEEFDRVAADVLELSSSAPVQAKGA